MDIMAQILISFSLLQTWHKFHQSHSGPETLPGPENITGAKDPFVLQWPDTSSRMCFPALGRGEKLKPRLMGRRWKSRNQNKRRAKKQ